VITITKQLAFDYGHRLLKHEGKCKNPHGHRGVVEVTITAAGLDDVGRVIDFSVVKGLLGGWLDEHWDHGFIVQKGDPLAEALFVAGKTYYVDFPPTAENLAEYLGTHWPLLLTSAELKITQIDFWETPTSKATWRPL
jgi:6-pyruvoyltetrahydropterin/6-carboxytetrahydropterin synthase